MVCAYATSLRRQTEPGSPARTMLDELFSMEYRCLFAFSHGQAAFEGVYATQLPDRHHTPSCGEPNERLFRVPDGVAAL